MVTWSSLSLPHVCADQQQHTPAKWTTWPTSIALAQYACATLQRYAFSYQAVRPPMGLSHFMPRAKRQLLAHALFLFYFQQLAELKYSILNCLTRTIIWNTIKIRKFAFCLFLNKVPLGILTHSFFSSVSATILSHPLHIFFVLI